MEQRGLLFPKTNSFIGSKQKLEDPEVFARKIQAMKDTQVDKDFQVVVYNLIEQLTELNRVCMFRFYSDRAF